MSQHALTTVPGMSPGPRLSLAAGTEGAVWVQLPSDSFRDVGPERIRACSCLPHSFSDSQGLKSASWRQSLVETRLRNMSCSSIIAFVSAFFQVDNPQPGPWITRATFVPEACYVDLSR